MNSNSRNWRPELCHIVSEVQLVISITLEMIQNITILRTNLGRSKVAAPLISTSSRLDELFFLVIDNSADQKVRKSMNFLSLGMKGYTNIRCKGLQGSKRLHSTGLLRSKVLNSVGLRQLSRESHIEGLQTSRTLHSVGPRKSDGSHSYRSESQPRPNTFNSAGQPTPDNSYSYRTKSLHRSKTVQDKILQTSEELYCHSFNDSPHPPFEGTQGSTSVLQTAIQALILQTSMVLKIARQYCHVVILMVILTQAACTVQVPINCMNAFVITSRNYPSTYPQFENVEWSVTAPEGRMILLTFNNFSLGPLGDITVIDTVDDGERQRYSGEENTISPFLSRRNTLLLRFRSDGTPTGNGFNISASCYDLSGIRVGRLTGGHTRAEGFLELQAESGGEWTRVCEEHSADRVAEVVCGELGFPGAKEVSYEQGWCSSERTGPVCIRAHSCENNAYRSHDCSASSNECISSKAVKVKCFEPGFKGCYDLDNIQPQDGSSYDSISKCITSCRADTYHAIAIINGNKCLCSTSDDIGLSSFSKIEARSCGPHQLVYNASVGFCVELDDVFHGSWDSNITWFGSIVHLICDDGYRLNGSGTLQCVREVSSYLPVWNGSTPTCEMITNSTSGTFAETTQDCQFTVKSTILKHVLMGSTYGLAAIIVIIVIYCITTQVRQHLSLERQDPASQISHTTLDITLPIQQGNADVGRVTIRTDSVLYETISDETLGAQSRRTEGEQDTGEDPFGYIIHDPQPNWNTKATADGATRCETSLIMNIICMALYTECAFGQSSRRSSTGGEVKVASFNKRIEHRRTRDANVARIFGGNSPGKGFLELRTQSDDWRRVCKDGFDERVTEVVCGKLGYPAVRKVSYGTNDCLSAGQDCIKAPICNDYTFRLEDCSWSSGNCFSADAVKVECYEPGFKGCYHPEDLPQQNGFVFESTSQCVSSCRAITREALAITNGTQCFCSTSDEVNLPNITPEPCNQSTQDTRLVINSLVYDVSVGFCDELDDVIHGSRDSYITWFGSIVHLTCDDGYRLNGGGTLLCVPGLSPYYPEWNGSVPTCDMLEAVLKPG
ncbi:uncharacterized protein LOC105446516 [Strongylocentrotus purpuratus]|uniref:Uncharacterized protein n=1 Tax=Strongylocentrotus purpuratus TaxID=7668 RepID=A0A7M7NP12_STRPU|nr:uncharacterized protein LOC105446516 [Strongylocentrotus purpuratus]